VQQVDQSVSLVGPGRAGTALALALRARGRRIVSVAGRTPTSPSTVRAAALLGAPAVTVRDAGAGADVVLVATPDAAIAEAAAALAPTVERGALVLHLSGASTVHELDDLARERPDVDVGSLHPLQSLPSAELGAARLAGAWCAIDGPIERLERLALAIGMRPFRVDAADRVRYHAAACVASNHLVALLGQVDRLADAAGVPREAFAPLVRATLDNVDALGAAGALTGPVARGDYDTVARHLDAIPDDERETYEALSAAAARLVWTEVVARAHESVQTVEPR
jgi:predicted short-subunit dehydrogenase-like oxidoreductase (DUF2520 family)